MKSHYIQDKELKSIQVDILRDVDDFCKRNDLRYSLAFGTLLGAIRHQGYIPWDDDIDIMMPRKDYEVFIKKYSSDRFNVICHDNCREYQIPFAKVHDPSTVIEELSDMKVTFGVYIDVFPIDNYPSDEAELKRFLNKKSILNIIHGIKTTALRKGRKWYKNVALAICKFALSFYDTSLITCRIEHLSQRYAFAETGFSGVLSPTDNRPKWRLKSELFNEYITVRFEGIEVSAIKAYDAYLTATYGDYMKLPPKEQQISHHKYVAFYK